MSVDDFSRNFTTDLTPVVTESQNSHEITEKYKTSLYEHAVVTTIVNIYLCWYVIIFPGTR